MKASATCKRTRSVPLMGDKVITRADDEEADTLFLESLVAEANRTLDSLNTVKFLVDEAPEQTSVRVSLRNSNRELGSISQEEIPELVYRVRELQGALFDGAGLA